MSSPDAGGDAALARLVREEAGLILASLHRRIGDFDLAEEAVQDAVVSALEHWRRDGIPPNPGGWLALAARHKAVDELRRRSRRQQLIDELAADAAVTAPRGPAGEGAVADERLPMLFGCCHPALAVEARLALTLRSVVGMTTAQVARAFLVPEPTMAQRLVRAKRKITSAGIPFVIPDGDALAPRLDDVLTVISVAYDAGYLDPSGSVLTADAIWLAELVAGALPAEPESWGLLALLDFLAARSPARFDPAGGLVVLADQDRRRWDAMAGARAEGYLVRAASFRRPGRFQLQAAIAAVHASAARFADTDWLQILTLYDLLLTFDPSPVVRLNQAVALAHVAGPRAALEVVEGLAVRLADYHLLHATRAALLAELGEVDRARAANEAALTLAATSAEQELLRRRLLA